MRKVVLIVNPISGRAGRRHEKISIIRYARELAREYDYSLELYLTRYPQHATELAQQSAKRGIDLVIAVGGDGTVNEVAHGLLNSQTALGIVPMGSGNGLARHLALSLVTRTALRTVLQNDSITMDCGLLNGTHFFTTAGIGFDAEVGWMFAKLGTRGIGSYIKATAQLFFKYHPRDYEIEIDGEKLERKALLITFANASQFGNNARIAPHALVNDGELQMVIVKPFPKIAISYLASLLFHGLVDTSSYIETISFRHLSIRCATPLHGHVDGEPKQLPEHFEVEVRPNVLRVVAGEHATEVSGEPAPIILAPYQYLSKLPRPETFKKRLRRMRSTKSLKS